MKRPRLPDYRYRVSVSRAVKCRLRARNREKLAGLVVWALNTIDSLEYGNFCKGLTPFAATPLFLSSLVWSLEDSIQYTESLYIYIYIFARICAYTYMLCMYIHLLSALFETFSRLYQDDNLNRLYVLSGHTNWTLCERKPIALPIILEFCARARVYV